MPIDDPRLVYVKPRKTIQLMRQKGMPPERIKAVTGIDSRTVKKALEGEGIFPENLCWIAIALEVDDPVTLFLRGDLSKLRSSWQNLTISAFSRALGKRKGAIAVCYNQWHPDQAENSVSVPASLCPFISVTYRETELLWTNWKLFPAYESYLHRLVANRVSVRRIFLRGEELACPNCRRALLRTLIRHQQLGFESFVLDVGQFMKLKEEMLSDVRCHTVAVCAGHALFMQFPTTNGPRMIATKDQSEVQRVTAFAESLWNCSKSNRGFQRELASGLTAADRVSVRKDVDFDLKAIRALG